MKLRTTFRAPLTALALAALGAAAEAQLAPGDIAVIGIHGDGTSTSLVGEGDAFAWVPLVNLPAGAVINFSDVGYFDFKGANNGFGSTVGNFEEGLVQYTVPAGGLAAGTVMIVDPMSTPGPDYAFVTGNAYTPDLTQDWVNLSGGGDQVVVFQDDDLGDTNNFSGIFAATCSTLDWTAAIDGDPVDPDNGGTGSESNLYPGLTDGVNAVAAGAGPGSLDEWDNARYVGVTTGTRAELLAAISNVANWEGTNDSAAPDSGGWAANGVTMFTVIGPDPTTAYCFGDGGGSPCPCGNTGGAGEGCANSTGSGATLTAMGTDSAGADDLTFQGANLLPSQPALLFVGEQAINGGSGILFGDGLRCAGQNVVRLGVMTPDANGDAGWGPGLGATGGWGSGDTRYFQGWYRDPSGGPCGAGFNLTNGAEITFGA